MTKLSPAEIHQQAADWVVRLYSGELTAQEERALSQWRQQPAHDAEFVAALHAWDLSAQLYACPTQPTQPKKWRWMGLGALAASALLITVWTVNSGLLFNKIDLPAGDARIVALPNPLETNDPETNEATTTEFRMTEQYASTTLNISQTFRTAVGEVSHIKLADGSTVSLNTNSLLKVTLSDDGRHAELISGEAFFDIAKDPNRPFDIYTEQQKISVLGTKFNVRTHSDKHTVEVAVLEGKVAVRDNQAETVDEPELLTAGHIGAFSDQARHVETSKIDQVKKQQSWRTGIVRFDDEPLQHVVADLNRYRTRKIEFADEHAKTLRISGVFHLKNGSGIITALAATLPISVNKTTSTVTIASTEH